MQVRGPDIPNFGPTTGPAGRDYAGSMVTPREISAAAQREAPIPNVPQDIDTLLTSAAIFLVVNIKEGADNVAAVQNTLGDMTNLVKAVSFRDLTAQVSCTVAIGSSVWGEVMAPVVTQNAVPKELKPFEEIQGSKHTAVSTPGDILFHIRANRPDLVFELERIIMNSLGDSVTVVDEVTGFRYFDERDLLGFVDGTANPVGEHLTQASLVGPEDPEFEGGAYVVVQNYHHDLSAWDDISVEAQETIIGHKKLDNVELPDATEGQKSHKTLNTITIDGVEFDILRDNMPFGSVSEGVYGTYFIGYTRYLWVLEQMLQNMYLGDPPPFYDKILDFSTPTTGTTFFAPPASMLNALGG